MFAAFIASIAGGLVFGIAAWVTPEPIATMGKSMAKACGLGMLGIMAYAIISYWWYDGRHRP